MPCHGEQLYDRPDQADRHGSCSIGRRIAQRRIWPQSFGWPVAENEIHGLVSLLQLSSKRSCKSCFADTLRSEELNNQNKTPWDWFTEDSRFRTSFDV
jgi:hypothetical protein